MMGKYGIEDYYFNDMANDLKTNHLDMTFQPYFSSLPLVFTRLPAGPPIKTDHSTYVGKRPEPEPDWTPSLRLETGLRAPPLRVQFADQGDESDEDYSDKSDQDPYDDDNESYDGDLYKSQAPSFDPEEPVEMLPREAPSQSLEAPPLAVTTEEVETLPTIPVPGLSSAASTKPKPANAGGGQRKRGQGNSGSLLKADGNTEAHQVEML
jgi:hypothetical protein